MPVLLLHLFSAPVSAEDTIEPDGVPHTEVDPEVPERSWRHFDVCLRGAGCRRSTAAGRMPFRLEQALARALHLA
jgi:hypothetical protein